MKCDQNCNNLTLAEAAFTLSSVGGRDLIFSELGKKFLAEIVDVAEEMK